MVEYTWTCSCCGRQHFELPTCWSCGPPASYAALSEAEAADRVEMNADMCIIDDAQFFIRGQLCIPIVDSTEELIFDVWSSLSEKSMSTVFDTWVDSHRAETGPFFGWLNTHLAPFGSTLNLPVQVVIRPPGIVPLIVVKDPDHPLAVAQAAGIGMARVVEIAEAIMPRH